jgi:deoxyribonuclease-4
MRIGAHVSAAGGLDKAVDRAMAIGAEAAQVFITPPQGWRVTEHKPSAVEAFCHKASESGVAPVFFHGVYLVNLATDSQDNLTKGINSLIYYMNFCPRVESTGVIFHVGSHRGAGMDAVFDRVVDAVHAVLEKSPPGVRLCLENNAGQGQQIGARFEELGRIVAAVGDDRLRVCLDTCHALASGYEIRTTDGLQRTLDAFDRAIGLDKLAVVHANDSKSDLGGNLDRHENIGDGFIGLEGWRTILAHPVFRDLTFLLEVPGVDGQSGPDKENVDRLKAVREEVLAEVG